MSRPAIRYHVARGTKLRVGRTDPPEAAGVPLLIFNGIGSSLEVIEGFTTGVHFCPTISFDMPGVGGSPLSLVPRRPWALARLAKSLLEELQIDRVNVLGLSWGGMIAQQFALQYPELCERLVLAATSPGQIMVPARPLVLLRMSTPMRYASADYFRRIAGSLYGGDFRTDRELVRKHTRRMAPPHPLSYLLQLWAVGGWTSLHKLHRIQQPTLVLAGSDDPIIPRANARILASLIPTSQVEFFDCGHLFLLTRTAEVVARLERFLRGTESRASRVSGASTTDRATGRQRAP